MVQRFERDELAAWQLNHNLNSPDHVVEREPSTQIERPQRFNFHF